MKHINENPRIIAAMATLNELTAAEVKEVAEENRLVALVNAPTGQGRLTPLDTAMQMLKGEPTRRENFDGLILQLANIRERLDVLRQAIAQQRGVIAATTTELSAMMNAEATPRHRKAAQGIADALEGLRAAFDVCEGIKLEMEAAGYRYSLEPLTAPELNFADPSTPVSRLYIDLTKKQEAERLQVGGSINARLLVDVEGHGRSGDVVKMTGSDAARLLLVGRIEATTAKVSKAPRPLAGWGNAEPVLS